MGFLEAVLVGDLERVGEWVQLENGNLLFKKVDMETNKLQSSEIRLAYYLVNNFLKIGFYFGCVYSIVFIIYYVFGDYFGSKNVFLLIFLSVSSMFSLIEIVPNFIRDHKYCSEYYVSVEWGKRIKIFDNTTNREYNFFFGDLIAYSKIRFSYSTYEALILEFKSGSQVAIYSTMSNYSLLKKQLKKITGIKYSSKFMPIGSTIKNKVP